jgi:carbon-monoxide dehydrogenase small subunit
MRNEPAQEPFLQIVCQVNGASVRDVVSTRVSLVDWLRSDVGLTGTHVGCEHGVCGACGVVMDGRVIRGCLALAVEADGREIETIEGATKTGRVALLQQAFYERAALQCGFCTPAMILQAAELLAQNIAPTRAEIRTAISGNYCRCTGYEAIVDAIEIAAARARR